VSRGKWAHHVEGKMIAVDDGVGSRYMWAALWLAGERVGGINAFD
jgi:hypothetical protein